MPRPALACADARWFEAQGKPAVALLSDAFSPQARYQARILGAARVRHSIA